MADTSVYYEVANSRLDAQMQRIDQLDAKVATAYASGSAILAVFAGLLSVGSLPSNVSVKTIVLVLLGLAGIGYVALLVCLFLAFRVSEWSIRPNLEDLQNNWDAHDDDAVRRWVADECILSIKYNRPLIAKKADWLFLALIAFAAEAILLGVAGGVALVGK